MKISSRNLPAILLVFAAVWTSCGAGLVNGDFESPVVTGQGLPANVAPPGFGWTIASGDIDILGTYWQPATGFQSLDLNGSTTGSIYQDFTFDSAGTWAFSFSLSANPDAFTRGDGGGTGVKNMQVLFGTPGSMTSLGTWGVDSDPRTIDNMQWVTITTPAVVVSSSTVYRVQFTSLVSGPSGPALDNVQVSPIPEPNAAALLCVVPAACWILRRGRGSQAS
jgi:hypothetical protein